MDSCHHCTKFNPVSQNSYRTLRNAADTSEIVWLLELVRPSGTHCSIHVGKVRTFQEGKIKKVIADSKIRMKKKKWSEDRFRLC